LLQALFGHNINILSLPVQISRVTTPMAVGTRQTSITSY